jgi:hypothetical protein
MCDLMSKDYAEDKSTAYAIQAALEFSARIP